MVLLCVYFHSNVCSSKITDEIVVLLRVADLFSSTLRIARRCLLLAKVPPPKPFLSLPHITICSGFSSLGSNFQWMTEMFA